MPAYVYPVRYAVPEARDRLTAAVLRSIRADHYANDADPNADAESEYAADQVALAARDLVESVNRLEPHQQPLGWPQPSASAPEPQ